MTLGTAVALDVTLAAAATFLGERTALPCADSIIYATAQPRGAEVWTHDGHFRGLPGVRFVETPAAPRAAPLRGALDRRRCHSAALLNVTTVYCMSTWRFHGSMAILTGR
jgi:hypothetical protein